MPRRFLALRPNPFEQHARRFVGRVPRDEFAGEGAGEDRLAQPLGALEVGGDRLLHLLDDRQPALDLGDDAVLFGEGWDGNLLSTDLTYAQRVQATRRTGNAHDSF